MRFSSYKMLQPRRIDSAHSESKKTNRRNWRFILRRKKSNVASSLALEIHSNVSQPCDVDNLWLRAEQSLLQDKSKCKLWNTYLEILESELESKLEPSGSPESQQQLSELIEKKTHELESAQWKVRLGEMDLNIRNTISRILKNILLAKDITNGISNASPPAAIACAGAFVVITVCKLFVVTGFNLNFSLDELVFTSVVLLSSSFTDSISFLFKHLIRTIYSCKALIP